MNFVVFESKRKKTVHLRVNNIVSVYKEKYLINNGIQNDKYEYYYIVRATNDEYFITKEEYERLIYLIEKGII